MGEANVETLPQYKRTRVAFKYLHVITSCIWLGAGLSVMVLLLASRTATSDEAIRTFNLAIHFLDYLLIIPSAGACFITGIAICFVAGLGLVRCSWIMKKVLVTVAALLFGALCVAPKADKLMHMPQQAEAGQYWTHQFLKAHLLYTGSASFQTGILLYVILISVLKPCNEHKNCINCQQLKRESSHGERRSGIDRRVSGERRESEDRRATPANLAMR